MSKENNICWILGVIAGVIAGWVTLANFPFLGWGWALFFAGLVGVFTPIFVTMLFDSSPGEAVMLIATIAVVGPLAGWGLSGLGNLLAPLLGPVVPWTIMGLGCLGLVLLALLAFSAMTQVPGFGKALVCSFVGAVGGVATGFYTGATSLEHLALWFAGGLLCGFLTMLAFGLLAKLVGGRRYSY